MPIDYDKLIKDLEEACQYENTELGEWWGMLCEMWSFSCHLPSDEFITALEKEIAEQHEWLKNNFTWVEHNEPPCEKCGRGGKIYRELVFNDKL
jgi:hypothetical protein